jgi:hypothetical protein
VIAFACAIHDYNTYRTKKLFFSSSETQNLGVKLKIHNNELLAKTIGFYKFNLA